MGGCKEMIKHQAVFRKIGRVRTRQKRLRLGQQRTTLSNTNMYSTPPFALFVLVDVSTDQLNKVLEAAFKGTEFSKNTFWLPSSEDDYLDAPKKVPREPTEGTKPPVSSYKSPFIGWKGEDVAKWLKSKPKEAAIDVHFFAIVDNSAEKGFLVIGRQGGRYLEDMDKLEFMRLDTEFATASIYAAQSGTWEEIKTSKGLADIEY
ncbi:hypothetical protein N0V83_009203 [Neocucurbitaria cava]|uniref:Uncharacterized protein n=1 Tax=Neocucurbitaria cava TaxID=798079 RepID=A0A9W9CIW8_9PLEO|nr:hypothetical protein N0V83_009203 [Neocucurbitaria cava]